MRKQNTEHRAQNTEHRTQKNSLGSGVWGLRSKSGFTLVELMIAITITVLAMAAVYTSFIVQQRSFTTQDQVAETEVSSKIGFDMLVNDIRTAGFGYPDDENLINTFPVAINATDSGINGGPDTLTLVGGFRQIATLQNATTVGSDQIMINYTGSTRFNSIIAPLSNRSNLSIEGLTFASITNCTLVDGTCSGAAAITLDRGVDRAIPAGRPVYLVEDVTYRIAADANGVNNLEKVWWINNNSTTDVIANNIDDFQVAEIDQDGDGTTDRLRVNLLARTAGPDQTLAPATKPYFATGITLENNATADTDRLRRRIWSMEVALRN